MLRQGLIRGEPQGRTWHFHAIQDPAALPRAPGDAVVKSDQADTSVEARYPHVARWVGEFGWIEIGQDDDSRSMVRVLDAGGMIWEGKTRYSTLDALLQDLDGALAEWFKTKLWE